MLFALLLACPSPTETNPDVEPGPRTPCDPLDEGHCLFPFPSSHFLAEDGSTATGYRVALEQGSFVTHRTHGDLDPSAWNTKDGFSINSTLIFFFEEGSAEGLVSWRDIGASMEDGATTVLIDATTGEKVPHFVDLDQTAVNPTQRAYTLHPAVPLEYDRDYVVGVRGLTKHDGDPVRSSDAFLTLRRGDPTEEGNLAYRVRHYNDVVFPALEANGFPRAELQLAWSFRTSSQQSSIGEMLAVRNQGLQSGSTPDVVVVSSEDGDCAGGATIGRTVELEVEAPLFTVADGPGNGLNRGDRGPVQNGLTRFMITARIPCSVLEGGTPAPVLQYGHGLLGSRGEVRTGWLSRFIEDYGWIAVASDWIGMSEDDIPAILELAATDPATFGLIPERSMQGVLQALLVIPALRQVVDDPAFQGADGTPLLDLEEPAYYGNSQGGIMGATLMSLSPDIDRGVLGVTGVNYGLMLPRSTDFELYFQIVRDGFADGREITLLVQGMFQQLWDASEGAGYVWTLNRDPLPDIPPKDVLLHTAIGDTQVTSIAGQIQARAYGAKLVAPTYRDVYGLETVEPGFTGSALIEWHYTDAGMEPDSNTPPHHANPHECPRREPTGQAQIDTFLRTGVVQAPCDGEVCSSTIAEVCP